MTTAEINGNRLDLFRGEFATLVVSTTRERLRAQQQRIIAIGRSVNGGAFMVTAPVAPPADFAEAVAEVDSRQPVAWTAAQHDDVDAEKIGEDIGRQPFLY